MRVRKVFHTTFTTFLRRKQFQSDAILERSYWLVSAWGNACRIGELRSKPLLNMSRSAFFVKGRRCFLQNVMFYLFLVQQGPRSFLSDVTVELRSLFWNSVRDRNAVSWRLLSSCLVVLNEWEKSDSADVAYEFTPGHTEGTYLLT